MKNLKDDELIIGVQKLLYSESQILEKFGLSRYKFLLGIKKGLYPPPVQVGPRRVAWRYSNLQRFVGDEPIPDSAAHPESSLSLSEATTTSILGLSRGSLRSGIKAGIYPPPHHVAPHCIEWLYRDLEAFVNALPFVEWRGYNFNKSQSKVL